MSNQKCKICGENYPSKDYFKTDTICNEYYKKSIQALILGSLINMGLRSITGKK